ncbi:hypothetical protein Cgig2_015864 [Carnegiea gigantea]|uniref:Reverse transcriptase zinc-binding domain-containing protein n=1 Tax=Carnegiea gigantea TaxID=171969 RepID=A0A9Q1GUP3_9CARY|nr:hypothetical protein Cgig2_015864 [Carnegiea gigantea]
MGNCTQKRHSLGQVGSWKIPKKPILLTRQQLRAAQTRPHGNGKKTTHIESPVDINGLWHSLPTKTRLAKFFPQRDTSCILCKQAQEDEKCLFFTCPYAQDIWRALQQWWYIIPQAQDSQELLNAIQQLRIAKIEKMIACVVISAAIYHTWSSKNQMLFDNKQIPGRKTIHLRKEQVKYSIPHMNKISGKYSHCID